MWSVEGAVIVVRLRPATLNCIAQKRTETQANNWTTLAKRLAMRGIPGVEVVLGEREVHAADEPPDALPKRKKQAICC